MTEATERTVDFLPSSAELKTKLDANIREAKLLRATLKLALRAEAGVAPVADDPTDPTVGTTE